MESIEKLNSFRKMSKRIKELKKINGTWERPGKKETGQIETIHHPNDIAGILWVKQLLKC